jgi:signal transduction histidine kinase/CheY-like chemotaxis protein
MSSPAARNASGGLPRRDLLDDFFEAVPFTLMLVDRDMRVERINRRGAESLGRRPEEVPGRLCGETLRCLNAFEPPGCGRGAPCADCTLRAQVAQAFSTGAPLLEAVKGRFRIRADPGEQELEALISTAPMQLDGRELVLATVVDVTDKAILESRLAQAQKMEAIGTLAGGIAHDFNNILGVIIGNAELLEMGGMLSDAERYSLGQILAAARRAKHLVRQILAFSRRSPQERFLISLKPIVKETVGFLRASLPAAIAIEQAVAADAAAVVAEPTQIQQVLLNLCTNAAQAMGPEGGRLKIGLDNVRLGAAELGGEPGADPGDYVRLSVADTGPGIDPGLHARIFEPFFTTKGPEKGTGLGLAVVHGVVKAHGGIVRVASRPGEGARFDVFLPCGESAAAAAAPEQTPLPIGRERLLFVDDEHALAELTRQQLSGLGYRVEAHTAPMEALAAFQADPAGFDLVMSDLSMPQMSGLVLARRLRAIRPELPIILCTGFSEQADEAAARAAGVREFLFKPLLLHELAQAVRRALDEPRRPEAAGQEG